MKCEHGCYAGLLDEFARLEPVGAEDDAIYSVTFRACPRCDRVFDPSAHQQGFAFLWTCISARDLSTPH